MTLTLKSYSGQLIFDPDSIVSSLILQSNIINLLYLIVQEKFSLFTHTDRLGAEGMQQVHPPPILKFLYQININSCENISFLDSQNLLYL